MAIFSSYAKWSRKILYPFDIMNESVCQEYDLAFDLFGNVLIELKLVNIGGVLFLGMLLRFLCSLMRGKQIEKHFKKRKFSPM